MPRSLFMLFILFMVRGFAQECPPADTLTIVPAQNLWQMPVQNNWAGLEVMTWNIRQFPQNVNTVSYVNEMISDLQPDVILFQEITDLDQFQNLADGIPAYTFIHTDYYSSSGYPGLDLGMAVRSDCVEITNYETLFSGYGYEFAWRYPLKADLRWECGSAALDFEMITVHFKCCDEGFDRRLASSQILHNYILNRMNYGNQPNIIVAGDFNDEIDEPQNDNSLWPLVSDTENLYFTTFDIVSDPAQASYPWGWYNSFIDHILISSGLFDENASGDVLTFRADDYMGASAYQNVVSDHRPVIWKIPLTAIDIPTGLVINEIMNNPAAVSDTYGEWFELTNTGDQPILLNGLIIADNITEQHVIQSSDGLLLNPGGYFVLGRNADTALNGGIILDYTYSAFNLNNTWDAIIIRHPSGIILDEVYYDNGATFPDPSGASMALTDPELDNALGVNWVVSTQPMPGGDYGTPGAENFPAEGCTHNGDVNQDGITDVLDLVSVVGYILGNMTFSDQQICIGDRNNDNLLDVLDLVLLVDDILNNY